MDFDIKSGCRTPFSATVSNSVQIYAKMADLWPKLWFSTWWSPPSWILQNINFAGKTSYRTHFLSLCQILCESIQKWPSYGLITDFIIAAAAILDFCTMWILMANLAAGPIFSICFKFGANIHKNGRLMAKSVIFNMAPAAILDFAGCKFCR